MVTATKSPEELMKERLARFEAAVNLEKPDRVPLMGFGGDIVAAYAGFTQHDMYYNPEKAAKAIERFNIDFPCDSMGGGVFWLGGYVYSVSLRGFDDLSVAVSFIDGPLHDIIGEKFNKFPGREIHENATGQFLGGTFMEPDEYDELIEDPINFIAEKVVPRTSDNLSTPRKAMATWVKVGMELQRRTETSINFDDIARKLGYPIQPSGWAGAPLDIIGDFLRGFDQVMLDIYRYPDKVKKATESLCKLVIEGALESIKMGAKYINIPLHLNEYLSPKLYNEFYWPTLKEVILEIYKAGGKSMVFFEGQHEHHLETLLELPKGWGVAGFEKTDVVKAKELLKGHTCIMGGLPVSLLVSGTPETIDEYVKNLLEKVKPGGGFMLGCSVGSIPADTPPENLTAVIEAVEKYGKY